MIPYHTRRILRRIFVSLVVLALVTAGVLLCWLLWLNRYVVYTRDGVELDFNMSLEFPQGELAVPPTAPPPVDIYYNEGENAINTIISMNRRFFISLRLLCCFSKIFFYQFSANIQLTCKGTTFF